ncbi:MAG: hypothetical protein L0Z62_40665 [Gemmataceae bacterium]|nr:hypothetical protein [Gemmataceae bacterium]
MSLPSLADARISLINPLVPAAQPAAATSADVSPSAATAQWDRLLDDLLRMRALEDDWDGQGASALNPANVDRAIAWVQQMRCWERALPPVRVVPGVTGELILEWQAASFYLTAELSQPDRVEWMLALPGQPTRQWETEGTNTWFVAEER